MAVLRWHLSLKWSVGYPVGAAADGKGRDDFASHGIDDGDCAIHDIADEDEGAVAADSHAVRALACANGVDNVTRRDLNH